MRKNITIAFLLVLTTTSAWAQSTPKAGKDQAIDSAQWVVDRYQRLMNIDGLYHDSILYMESIIYYTSSPTDTAILKRWFLPPNRFRSELWHGDTLLEGAYTDGKHRFREINIKNVKEWTRVAESRYYNLVRIYEFRGPLYNWQANGAELTYQGVWNFQGNDVYRIYMEAPERYNTYLLFEKEGGLLFLEQQTNKHSAYSNHQAKEHASLHGIHEYYPIGRTLLPSVESFQMEDDMMLYYTTYRYLPVDMKIFTED